MQQKFTLWKQQQVNCVMKMVQTCLMLSHGSNFNICISNAGSTSKWNHSSLSIKHI